ncbi:M48 family metalloprotease [Herbidospora mongoliensis]|uniref:M48 family metalloprotease n=1 Tax=Herbidospora mongoliensis TaxID=688067 RepID=UPI001471BE54|nr:M48 family metalloprotease [Herbidospora mongoliensis]
MNVESAVADPVEIRPSLLARLAPGWPAEFPIPLMWLETCILRNPRGTVTALVAAWLFLPAALGFSVTLAIVGGLGAFAYTAVTGDAALPALLLDAPVLGDALQGWLVKGGGVGATLLGAIAGAIIGFTYGLVAVFLGPFQDGFLDGAAAVLGTTALGVMAGLLYTLYRTIFEHRILILTGARRLSRREADLLFPLIAEAAARLKLANHPILLVDDSGEPNAFAYTRHIVINRGFLEEFDYNRDAIAAVLTHELVHWRNGDPVSGAFIRGVAFPLYLVQAVGGRLLAQAKSPVLRFLVWTVFWPVFVTVRHLVVPMQAADSRRAEYRADQGAVLAGYRGGMRRILTRFRRSFEGGRNGWVEAMRASHPPNEFRLERIEEPGRDYPLPEDDFAPFEPVVRP